MKKQLLMKALESGSIKKIFDELTENEEFEVLGLINRKIQSIFTPFVDVYEENDFYVVVADVPGYEKEDLEVEVLDQENKIRVFGQREKKMVEYIEEGRSREFEKEIKLPQPVKGEGEAELEDGVLEIKVRKSEKDKTKVEVK